MAKFPDPTDRSKVDPTMPLRLEVAARLAFPDGSIKASALRTEAKKGRLEMLRVANKDLVTLAAVDAMIERCKVPPTAPASAGSPSRRQPPRPSSGKLAIARDAALARIRERMKPSRED